jgi:hypothetical protein
LDQQQWAARTIPTPLTTTLSDEEVAEVLGVSTDTGWQSMAVVLKLTVVLKTCGRSYRSRISRVALG